ncbi:MAG: hypothetical protein PQJ58_14255 [Spirochaetales bacterium]|nr:hypothetical protein [Spirochaetales bacterium]
MNEDSKRGIIYFGGYPLRRDMSEECARIPECVAAEASLGLKDVWPKEEQIDFTPIDDFIEPWIEAGKKANIRVFTAHNCAFFSPRWLFEDRGIRLIHEGWFCDFETGTDGYRIHEGALISASSKNVISGKFALSCQPGKVLSTGSQQILKGEEEYLLQFDYRCFQDSELTVCLSSDRGRQITASRLFSAGEAGLKQIYLQTGDSAAWTMELTLEKGEISLDNLHLGQVSASLNRNTGFPDYFNPLFQQYWETLVHKLGECYNNHPSVDTVSIGGFGRWEEMILDTDEMGRYDRQWLACGYSDQAYLRLIRKNIDLFTRAFPDKELELQLAYGLDQVSDKALMYRRMASEAAARGLSLKQNGLSEKYDAWENSDNSHASWVFNRLKFSNDVKLTHETGGQVYNNYFDVMGHPVSLLNRGLINGIDYFYLYDLDILQPHMNKYFNYAVQQISCELFTRFYCRHGLFPLPMRQGNRDVIMEYANIWLGLRHYMPPEGLDKSFTADNGQLIRLPEGRIGFDKLKEESCAALKPGQSLFYDTDQRYLYYGLSGGVFHLEYYDGTADFTVYLRNGADGSYETVTSCRGYNSGEWKTFSFAEESRLFTTRNDGEDDHIDIIVRHTPGEDSNNRLYVRHAEIDFVPLREFRDSLFLSEEPVRKWKTVDNELIRDLYLESSSPISRISIPLQTDSLLYNRAGLEVYRHLNGEWQLIHSRELAGFDDRESFDVYLAARTPGSGHYRILLRKLDGNLGWYLNDSGEPAVKAAVYEYIDKKADAGIIDQPFGGLSFNNTAKTLEIRRVLPDQELTVYSCDSPACQFYFPPLPGGRYRIICDGKEIEKYSIFSLKRKQEPKDFKAAPYTESRRAFSPVTDSTDTGSTEATENQILNFELKNTSAAGLLKVSWESSEYSAAHVFIPVVPNDNRFRTYSYPIGLEPHWKGSVSHLKIRSASAQDITGTFTLKNLHVSEQEEILL